MQKFFIKNQKGQNIAAAVHYAVPETNKLAILCPGYLDTKDYDHLVKLAETLAKQGYTTIRFDPTGTWESEGTISDYTNTQYLEDIKSVLEYMLKESMYTHVLLGGHSRGGQISLLYAARDPRISVVVGIMPSSGPAERKTWNKNGLRISVRDVPNSSDKREYKVPVSHMIDRNKYDVAKDVAKIHVPVIFIAGQLDTIILSEDVKKLYDNAHEPKKFILMKDIGHDYRFSSSEIKMVNDEIVKAL